MNDDQTINEPWNDSDFPSPHLDPPELNDLPLESPAIPKQLTLAELVREIGNVKARAAAIYAEYASLRDIELELKAELFEALHMSGLKSIKGEDYTASITEKPTIAIKDEKALMEWLDENPDIEAEFYIGVKKKEFSALANSLLKDTGEMADGTIMEIRESLAIKANKKG